LTLADSSSNPVITQAVSITLSLLKASTSTTNSGLVLTGAGALNTASGVVTFTGLKVLSSGDFNLKVVGLGVQTWTGADFSVINHVKTLVVSSTASTYAAYSKFPVTVTLTGDDDNSYILTSTSITLALPTNTFADENPLTTDATGAKTFQVYATADDSYTFSATTNSDLVGATYTSLAVTVIEATIVIASFNTVIIT